MNEKNITLDLLLELLLCNILECRKFFKDCLLAGGYKNPHIAFTAEQFYKRNLVVLENCRKVAAVYKFSCGGSNGDIFKAINMFEKELHCGMDMLRNTGCTAQRAHFKLTNILVGLAISILILTVSIGVQIIWGNFHG